ncbi:MAG: SDR family oxidoreductase [Rhizobiaceae bacterium]
MADIKVAIVTGAGSGIGKASAIALLNVGWTTVFVGRRADKLDEAIAEAGDVGINALAVPTDVTSPEQVDALYEMVVEKYGRVDLLFNNAGMGHPAASIDELAVDKWLEVIGVNLTGSFLMARGAFRTMRHQKPMGGRIINNGSISAHVPRPGSIGYTATKHAVTGLTKTMALDGRPYSIAIGQIDVGNALTEMAIQMTKGMPQANGSIEVEPVMDVQLVAESIVHMAGLPLEANIPFLTVMATNMPFFGRG